MLYFANPCGPAVIDAMLAGELGFIDTPKQGNKRPEDVLWCADNGCYSNAFSEPQWWGFLERNAGDTTLCAFATAPDVVGDARATFERSLPWLPKIRALGYPVAFVAQDGITDDLLPWDEFDALFIGGSTEWKLGAEAAALMAEGRTRGKWVHCGRVNSRKRYRQMKAQGCHSVDGTYLTFGPNVNLPRLLSWVREA